MRDNAESLQRPTVPNCCVSLFFCVTFDIVSGDCAENLNDDSQPDPVITLQTSDMTDVTPDQTVTLSSGTSSITVRFGSSDAGYKVLTRVTAVILSFVDQTTGSPPMMIRLEGVTFSNGTTAQDIGDINSSGPNTGMFRLGALGEEPVDALVFSVPDILPQDASSVDVVVRFDGCIKKGEYNLLHNNWFPYVNRPHGQYHFPHIPSSLVPGKASSCDSCHV